MSAPSSRVVRLHALLLGALSSAALADPGGIPAEVQALRGRVDAIQAQQASAQAQLGGLLSAVTNLTAASNSLRTAITALTGTDAAMQAKIAGLQSSVSVLQSTSTALSGQLARIFHQFVDLCGCEARWALVKAGHAVEGGYGMGLSCL